MDNSSPVLCGSISGSIGGLGVIMHNAAFKALNLDYTYVSFQPVNLENAISGMRALGIKGMGVSMPFKIDVINYLDELDESARVIGAVNTITNKEDKLIGYNTDCIGAIRSLEQITNLENKKIVVLGAGGASRAIVFALKKYTNYITIFNRNKKSGEELATAYNVTYGGTPSAFNRSYDYDILINTTSVGFKSQDTLVTAEQMQENKIVMDVVFKPIETTLIKTAKSLGCTVVEGYKMLLHQACCQFELYTGHAAPYEIMKQVLLHKIALEKV
jgi:shikimate dehydrogenase